MAKTPTPLDDTSWQTGQTPKPGAHIPASSTYADRRAELEAIATGGSAGRDAYREGRQRVVSDQRAAIDRALGAVPMMNREAGTNDFLESIIRPVGDAATARIDFAGDRFGSSMGALDSALATALAQKGSARDLNYSTTLSEGRLATDRSMNLAREQDAAAERRRAAAAAASGGMGDYTTGELKAIAELLGGEMQTEAIAAEEEANRKAQVESLLSLAGRAFGDLDPTLQGGLLDQVWANADDPAAIAALIAEYSPAYADEANDMLMVVPTGRATPAVPRQPDTERLAALNRMLDTFAGDQRQATQRERALAADRYLFDQDAYAQITGDPLLAAAVFPQDFGPAQSAMDDEMDRQNFLDTGLYGSQYNQWLKEQEKLARTDDQQVLFDIATGAGTSDTVVDKVVDRLAEDPTEVYELLTSPDAAATVTEALSIAAENYESGMSNTEIKREATTWVKEEAAKYDLGDYGDVLAAIVREQYDAIYG